MNTTFAVCIECLNPARRYGPDYVTLVCDAETAAQAEEQAFEAAKYHCPDATSFTVTSMVRQAAQTVMARLDDRRYGRPSRRPSMRLNALSLSGLDRQGLIHGSSVCSNLKFAGKMIGARAWALRDYFRSLGQGCDVTDGRAC